MTPTRLNDRLRSNVWICEEDEEENFPTHGTRMLSEDIAEEEENFPTHGTRMLSENIAEEEENFPTHGTRMLSENIAEENVRTHGTRMLSENIAEKNVRTHGTRMLSENIAEENVRTHWTRMLSKNIAEENVRTHWTRMLSENIAEENVRTHGTRMLSEDTTKSFLRLYLILQLASCVIAVSLDPLFLYIPVINHHEKCFHFDKKLRIAALVLRSVTDIIFLLHIGFQFRNVYVARPILSHIIYVPSLKRIRERLKTYRLSYFLIDILSLLPLPQVVILSIIPEMKGSKSLTARNILTALVLLQYVPRVVRIYPLYQKLKQMPRMFQGTPWTKAALNLFLYMLASHVLGALWYFFSIEREITCWQEACEGHPGCDHSSFFCDDGIRATEFLHDTCPVDTPNTNLFDFGIFLDALQSGIVESFNLPQKLFHCLWWGLKNMSSLGQNLKTSTYVWENIFAVFISTSGLILFLYFIGNIQAYMQWKIIKKEEKRMEIRATAVQDVDSWMSKNNLPEHIRREIKQFVEKQWHEIRIVNSENLIPILPMILQKNIKSYFCSDLVKRVPMLALMDSTLLDDMYGRLKPVVYSAESSVLQNGDRVKEMCFIFRGKVSSEAKELETGEFCGEELLTWVFNQTASLTDLPISIQTAQALTEVEAYTLTAEDLKDLISKFWKQENGVKLRRILRCYSGKWRTWAALVIQMACHRWAKRKLEESLRKEEIRLQDALANTCGRSTSAIFYVSRFTANVRGLIQGRKAKEAKICCTAMHLHKPDEEDSSYMWR